jgi:hypothetical protein|eukprot:evm.model.NODE_12852_length_22520_cov_36.652222.6
MDGFYRKPELAHATRLESVMLPPTRLLRAANTDIGTEDEISTVAEPEQPREAAAVDAYAPNWAWTADVGAAQKTDDELAERVTFIESGAVPERLTPHQTVEFKKEMNAYYLRANDHLLMHLSHDKDKPWRNLEAMIVIPTQLKSIVMRTYYESAMAGLWAF